MDSKLMAGSKTPLKLIAVNRLVLAGVCSCSLITDQMTLAFWGAASPLAAWVAAQLKP